MDILYLLIPLSVVLVLFALTLAVAVGLGVGVIVGSSVAVALGAGVSLGAGVNVAVGGGSVTLARRVAVAAGEQPASRAASRVNSIQDRGFAMRDTYGQGIGTASEKPCFSTVRISPFEG